MNIGETFKGVEGHRSARGVNLLVGRLDAAVARKGRDAADVRGVGERGVGGDGKGKLAGLEGGRNAPEVVLGVRRGHGDVGPLHGAVREAILGGDVDGGVLRAREGVHGVAAGLKDVGVDVKLGEQVRDAAVIGGLLARLVGVVAEEVLRVLAVEVRHAHLEGHGGIRQVGASRRGGVRLKAGGALAALGAVAVDKSTGVVVREVHVPLDALGLGAEDKGVAAVAERAKVPLEKLNLLVKVTLERLLVGPHEGGAGVLGAPGLHPELGRLLDEHGDGVQELGGAARLEDHLGRVDKERRLGEDVRVKGGAGPLGDDEALGGGHGIVEDVARKGAQACSGGNWMDTR